MRIWDVPVERLCRVHLLGEHRELHALWTIISQNKKGYAHHPETKRWVGKLPALFLRHQLLVTEMEKRGYAHQSPLDTHSLVGSETQEELLNTLNEQYALLAAKPCDCPLDQSTI